GVADASIVATHMMLAAANIGVGTTWVMHFDPKAMVDTLEIPENIIPVALLVMGYPADDAKPLGLHFESRPIEETVIYK
ncbi:MAG: nitroreductase family protein, partial [Clostridia bacterium]|nr:nitroreductase family protein [Clostridia bacterium]